MTTTKTRSGKVRVMLYEKEYELQLPVAQLEELEEVTGIGSHGILNRFSTYEFKVSHVLQVIRLGLIGSGEMVPQQAAHYVQTYLRDPKDKNGRTYVMDYLPGAIEALTAALYGPEDDQPPLGKDAVMTDNDLIPTPSPHGDHSTDQLPPSDWPHPNFDD